MKEFVCKFILPVALQLSHTQIYSPFSTTVIAYLGNYLKINFSPGNVRFEFPGYNYLSMVLAYKTADPQTILAWGSALETWIG